jgi:UDP-N-acetylmuramoyl-L-alanyl-D-glutamate--2,6-diaminopimelate ligase/murE/murF fusion protein
VKVSILADAIRKDNGITLNRWGGTDHDIISIQYHSKKSEQGSLFVAIPGFKADGHDFIDAAIECGACAVVGEKNIRQKDSTSWLEVDNSRKALAILSSCFYGNPSEHLSVVAITGTNGKTTTSFLIESILTCAELTTGVIGTINYRYAGKSFVNPVTTPESSDLQHIMADMRDNGVTHVVMEASSHALDLYRLYGCRIKVGVFTNFTQDHLDYHQTMESYWACKKRLFTEHLGADGIAVINCNDPKGSELAKMLANQVITIGNSSDNMIWIKKYQQDLSGINGIIVTPSGEFEFASPLVGVHNLENILCAVGTAAALNLPVHVIKAGIESLSHVPGRLEPVPNNVERFVYVDYAHTPDALKNVLSCLKKLAGRRLICVFGCGGDRDRSKRPLMGEIAARYADLIVVTSDNPRSEPPMSIIDEIVPGILKICPCEYIAQELAAGFEAGGYIIEADRRKAIELAISVSRADDVILIAGKGHENYQIIGDTRLHFDDKEEALRVLSDY